MAEAEDPFGDGQHGGVLVAGRSSIPCLTGPLSENVTGGQR